MNWSGSRSLIDSKGNSEKLNFVKVISLVPSWTETLIDVGIDVVGRTRFCIHPALDVKAIPVVGGTKDINWDLIYSLEADLVLLDREENPESMALECRLPYLDTHVTSIESLGFEFKKLGEAFENKKLTEMGQRVDRLLQAGPRKWDQARVPDLLDWVHAPTRHYSHVSYMIWSKPWMSVAPETYIGSVLKHLGATVKSFDKGLRYPTVELEQIKDSLVLFSSEPFPFHKKIEELKPLGLEGGIVNGESYSWFGKRGLEFLERACLNKHDH